MFSLHETTRIWICRVAFVLLCLMPTGVLAAWCVSVHMPSFRRAHERAVGQRLGWQATLAAVSTPRPGLLLYEGLELSDPESRQLLARIPFVEVDGSRGSETVTLAYPATLNGLRLDALLDSAERMMRADQTAGRLALHAPNVTLHLEDGDHTLRDVDGRLEVGDGESRLSLAFRLATAGSADGAEGQPAVARLTVTRRADTPARSVLSFSTGDNPLPCHLIASCWPAAKRLGQAATFAGRVTATRHQGDWTLELSGTIRKIDLEQLVGPFPHTLTGTATLHLQHATVVRGRLKSAAGTLVAGPGTISRSLIHAAKNNLRLDVTRRTFLERGNHVAYRQLNLAFEIDPAGLALRGEFPQATGAILVDDQHVLVRQGPDERLPVVNLLRTLVPQTSVQVPATRETGPLTAFLPVPPIVPPAGGKGPLPTTETIRVAPP